METYGVSQETYQDEEPEFFAHVAHKAYQK
jgi:hypothetical protein